MGKKGTQEYSIVSLCHIKVKVEIFLLFTSYLWRNINSQHCTLQNNWPVWADRSGPSRRVITRCNEPDLLSENKDYRGPARTKEEQQLPHLCGYFLKKEIHKKGKTLTLKLTEFPRTCITDVYLQWFFIHLLFLVRNFYFCYAIGLLPQLNYLTIC